MVTVLPLRPYWLIYIRKNQLLLSGGQLEWAKSQRTKAFQLTMEQMMTHNPINVIYM
jgi:hypothetical protein